MELDMSTFLYYCGSMFAHQRAYTMSRYTFQVATHFGHVPSARELGILLVKGQGGDVDIYEGSRLLHLAERAGDETAALALDSYLDF
jgi:hypothetical protein